MEKKKLILKKEVVGSLSSNNPIRGGYPTDAAHQSFYECQSALVVCEISNTCAPSQVCA